MSQILWFVLTWIAGTAAILGSFMTVGSLMLWFVPSVQTRSPKPEVELSSTTSLWQNRLKLLAVSVTIALAGLGILMVMPFPSF